MTTDRTTLEQGIQEIFNSLLCNVHTAIPAQVTAFDAATATVSVQPVLKRKFKDEDPVDLPIIEDVPVMFPGSGDYWIVFDIAIDSYVLLVFSERSIEAWKNEGGILDPNAQRKFDLSDAIAIPSLIPLPGAIVPPIEPTSITIRKKDGTKYIKLTDKIEIMGDVEVTGFLSSTEDIEAIGEIVALALIPALSVSLSTHTHSGVTTGPGTTGPPVPGT